MKKTILVFGALIIALLILFQIGKYAIISGDSKIEIIIAVIAIVFFFIGVSVNKRSLHKNQLETKEIDFKKN